MTSNNQKISYILRVSKRARNLSLLVKPGGELVVTAPFGFSLEYVENLVLKHRAWILKKLAVLSNFTPTVSKPPSRQEYLKYKEEARDLVLRRLDYFNQFYNFKIGRVAIRNQKTRWGSCSRQGNLNFSYRLALLPKDLADYVVVHELCHLGEFNHSAKFWQLVAKTIPDYKERQKQLKKGM